MKEINVIQNGCYLNSFFCRVGKHQASLNFFFLLKHARFSLDARIALDTILLFYNHDLRIINYKLKLRGELSGSDSQQSEGQGYLK